MSIRKSSIHEFHSQFKDIRGQLFDQVRCLEQRTIDQVAIFQEINDFLRKRAEIDLEYSRQLDKLVRSVMLKHKNEKQKRASWSQYSICNLWQHIVDEAKEEAKQRGIMADVYANHVVPAVANKCNSLQKVSKKCREIGVLAQGEVLRVLTELQTAMKTYQLCFAQFSTLGSKLQQAEAAMNKALGANSSTRKQRSAQKTYDKKSEKHEEARQKCTRARNEYLLCIMAANASLHKFFADDISDLVDCSDLGMDWWLSLVLQNVISARKSACQVEMNALANLSSFRESLQSQVDKQRFFESNHQIFMLPRGFDFRCDSNESVKHISAECLAEEFRQRHHQIRKRLGTLRSESEMSWRNMEQMERQIRDLLTANTLIQVNEFGIVSDSGQQSATPAPLDVDQELAKLYETYLQTFSFHLFNANLIVRLEARADGIGSAAKGQGLVDGPPSTAVVADECSSQRRHVSSLVDSSLDSTGIPSSIDGGSINIPAADQSHQQHGNGEDWKTDNQRRRRRIGSQASSEQQPNSCCALGGRPRLFGGGLEEYTEATGESIPLVVISCIRVLSQFALHQQGIFRISGSQLEITRMREAFENGEDPLAGARDSSDANSIAGLLKLYFRELREPLFPFYLFDLLTDCAKCSSTSDFISKISPLLNKLPPSSYLLLRYLFAFLNHLSEFSDENMMDPYNLAICFGPTLLPIPEGKDQVIHQNSVNEVVKNLIVHFDAIFNIRRLAGPRYEKYNAAFSSLDTPLENENEPEAFMDDEDPQSEISFLCSPREQRQLYRVQLTPPTTRYLPPFLGNVQPQQSLASTNSSTPATEHSPTNYSLSNLGSGTLKEEHRGSAASNTSNAVDRNKVNGMGDLYGPRELPANNNYRSPPASKKPSSPPQPVEIVEQQNFVLPRNYIRRTECVERNECPADLYASIIRPSRVRVVPPVVQQQQPPPKHLLRTQSHNEAGPTSPRLLPMINPMQQGGGRSPPLPKYSTLFPNRSPPLVQTTTTAKMTGTVKNGPPAPASLSADVADPKTGGSATIDELLGKLAAQ